MRKDIQPSEVAKEALKRLAVRKLSPTPMNYQVCYNEIAGIPNVAGFPEAQVRRIALALTARNPAQQEQLDLLDAAISRRSWQGMEEAVAAFDKLGAGAPANARAESQASDGGKNAVANDLLAKVARMIDCMKPALQNDDEHFAELLTGFQNTLRDPKTSFQDVQTEFDSFIRRLSFVAEEQSEIKAALLKLLHLIIDNVSKLMLEDKWMEGQMSALLSAVAAPLSLRRLDDVERWIQDVMVRQAAAKGRSLEAQEEMRLMLGAFIDRLASIAQFSTSYKGEIEESARKIENVKTVEDLAPLLRNVLTATRSMVEETTKAHDQLQTLRTTVLATEVELAKLNQELSSANDLASHDHLTRALNRKGFDAALGREIANTRRKDTPLSLALLDIDNFKNINDQFGHDTGDAALIHLVKVVRECLRPMDSLARYGGEEFVILMPDTVQDNAVEAMTRLQRNLTKNFFLAGDRKILITFSAGVAQLSPMESGEDAIKRADQAMYLAKRSGKNRVLSS